MARTEIKSNEAKVSSAAAQDSRADWQRPSVVRMEAGDAEVGPRNNRRDGAFTTS